MSIYLPHMCSAHWGEYCQQWHQIGKELRQKKTWSDLYMNVILCANRLLTLCNASGQTHGAHHPSTHGRLKHREAQTKRMTFRRRYFPMHFLQWKFLILIKISLKFILKGPINNIPVLVQIMAWRWPGNKPLSEPMMVRLPTHICITQPQ